MSKTAKIKSPKLNATAPIRFGLLALGTSVMLGAGLFLVDVHQGPVTTAAAVKRAEPVAVRHDMGGVLAQMHVAVGMDVAAGALIAQLDRRQIENELAALRKRIDARRMEIDGLKLEASALSAAGDKTAVRSRIAALEAEAVDADRAIVGHASRIGLLDGQLDRLDIRAPVAGRIVEIAQTAAGSPLAAKAAIAVIRPSQNRLQLDVVWPSAAGAQPRPGQVARIWSSGGMGGGVHLGEVEGSGTVTGSDSVDATDGRTGTEARTRIALDVTDTPLAELPPGLVLNVQLLTGTKSLAEHLFAPLLIRRSNDKIEGTSK